MEEYELYCLTHRAFYDRPDAGATADEHFRAADRPVPAGWDHHSDDTWLSFSPPHPDLPPQGWKIHVSSRGDDADRVLEAVWDYCLPRGLAFKFLRSRTVMVMLNSKAAPRGASGKLMTIYPADVDRLELVLKELDEVLTGVSGPYVLSDVTRTADRRRVERCPQDVGRSRRHARSRSLAFSPTIMAVRLGLTAGRNGRTDASATRSPATPRTRSSGSTTAIGSLAGPIFAVHAGW